MSAAAVQQKPAGQPHPLIRLAAVLGLLFIFLMGVKGLGDGFKLLGRDLLEAFFTTTENPFIGLLVGILATSIVQSSSVTTSMIVGLVAAPENPLPLANAVPMVMGANIGTTVTSTIVSLAHMGRRSEFRRAFSVGICHDFFNYSSVLILLPLELATGYLRATAGTIARALEGAGGFKYESPLKGALSAALDPFERFAEAVFPVQQGQAVFLILLSAVFIFVSLYLLVKVMRSAMRTRVERFITDVLGSSALLSMAVGTMATVMVQSSSITTSLLVPLGGAGLITLEQAFPITIGANVGTTITALLASLAVSGPNAAYGIQIALIHLLFNISGTMLIYPTKKIRNIPLGAARWMADWAVESRKVAILFVGLLFFVIPGAFIFLYNLFS
jgi:sodium-dependent phosphate cotransporter